MDINPTQGHLLELKLAALTSLPYADFWRLFGEGYHPAFSRLLDTYMSPYMSSHAYQFWKRNSGFDNIYETGASGIAIKAFGILARIMGLHEAIQNMCTATSLDEQNDIWQNQIRPHFLSRKWIGLLSNNKFAWDALGVPKRQFEMLLKEGSVYDYIVNTFDPVCRKHLLSEDGYFYHLCLQKRYAGNALGQCPSYLTREGFSKLKTSRRLEAIQIHTAPILSILEQEIVPGSLTKVILMDSQVCLEVNSLNDH